MDNLSGKLGHNEREAAQNTIPVKAVVRVISGLQLMTFCVLKPTWVLLKLFNMVTSRRW